jgi:hypothetical protein
MFLITVQGCNDVGCGQESPEVSIYSAEDVPQVAPNQVILKMNFVKIIISLLII